MPERRWRVANGGGRGRFVIHVDDGRGRTSSRPAAGKGSMNANRDRCFTMFNRDRFHDPEFRNLVRAARAVIAERVGRGIATPAERLAGAAIDEMPDEDDPDAVRAWAPSAAFRDAVRSAALATLALYVGIVETLADEADRDDGGGETMH